MTSAGGGSAIMRSTKFDHQNQTDEQQEEEHDEDKEEEDDQENEEEDEEDKDDEGGRGVDGRKEEVEKHKEGK